MKNRLFVVLVFLGLVVWMVYTLGKAEIQSPVDLELALNMAKDNRKELEKVLHRYSINLRDSLKYKAAYFLIENMPYYYYRTSKQRDNYLLYFEWLKNEKYSPQILSDSIKKTFGPIGTLRTKYDIREVDSAYLCSNIEWAFKVWQEQPWGKNVPFEIFCEYVLPYRIEDEPLAYWREMYYERFSPLLDSLRSSIGRGKEDPLIAARCLMERLPNKNGRCTGIAPMDFGHIGPEHALFLTGSCQMATDFTIYLFRALGIPCAIDFTPVLGFDNARHFWLACWDKNGENYMVDFLSVPSLTRRHVWCIQEDNAKVYRQTFSINRELKKKIQVYGEKVYPFWLFPRFVDVTPFYGYHCKGQLEIPFSKLYSTRQKAKIAYLCFSSQRGWIPVDWTEYTEGHLLFKDIKMGGMMRIATYEKDRLCFVTDPFQIDKFTNEFHFYTCNNEKQDVILYSKYFIRNEDEQYSRQMLGGVFEGSNKADFSDKDTLYIIQRKPYRLITTVKSRSDKKYRYLRYVGWNYSYCDVAEVAFYEPNSLEPIKGRIIGTAKNNYQDGSHEITNVFDGKTWTSFDYVREKGVELDEAKQVDRLSYTPRNMDNYIRPGDEFELLYCDVDWKSAGVI